MSKKLDKFIAILSVGAVLIANAAMSFADDVTLQDFELTAETQVVEEVNIEEIELPGLELLDRGDPNAIIAKQDVFLSRIQEEFNLSKAGYQQLLTQIVDTKERLKKVAEDKVTLAQQLQGLDDEITLTTEKLLKVIAQVVETENTIKLLYEQIEMRQIALDYQKELLKDYIRVIYEEENAYYSFDENGEVDAFKLLLASGSVGENMKNLKYFDLLNEAGQQMVDRLDVLATEVEDYQDELNGKREQLLVLQDRIGGEKMRLEEQRVAKEQLLVLTLGQEQIYQQLLAQTAEEQGEMLTEVQQLNEALVFVQQKIAEEGREFNPDDYSEILDFKTKALYDFQFNFTGNPNGFAWPVDPDRGISAYFRDSGYVGVFGVQHNAVDIPIYQGSPIRAAADAVVYTAKDNGYGYSYIILAHSDGFVTVYGHVSNILVKDGQTVSQGAIIGLSGGMPGTKGAGYMTTGPHLHFEMKLNGLFVDPLIYLPMEKFTVEQAESLPEKYRDDWEDAVLGEPVLR